MDEVSESVTGQDKPKPTREERDEAFSNGAGRKAVEKPKAARKHDREEEAFEAPVGLEIETRGDDEAK